MHNSIVPNAAVTGLVLAAVATRFEYATEHARNYREKAFKQDADFRRTQCAKDGELVETYKNLAAAYEKEADMLQAFLLAYGWEE